MIIFLLKCCKCSIVQELDTLEFTVSSICARGFLLFLLILFPTFVTLIEIINKKVSPLGVFSAETCLFIHGQINNGPSHCFQIFYQIQLDTEMVTFMHLLVFASISVPVIFIYDKLLYHIVYIISSYVINYFPFWTYFPQRYLLSLFLNYDNSLSFIF